MDNILYHFVPKEILCQIFSTYLLLEDVSHFDVALCNHKKRLKYLKCLGSQASIWPGDKERKFNSLGISWLITRNMKIKSLNCGTISELTVGKIAGFGVYLERLDIDGQSVSDIIMIKIAESCPNIMH